MEVKPKNYYSRQAVLQIVAGGSAGFVEVCFMQPLALVKTRLQLQRTGAVKISYVGVIDCFKTMYINEGLFSFYKGIVPPILAETPKRAVKVIKLENILNISRAFQVIGFGLSAIV